MKMNAKVQTLYGQLIELMKPKYGNTHGLFITHKGSMLPDKHVLFVGRETNGIPTELSELTESPKQYQIADTKDGQLKWLIDKSSYHYRGSPFFRVIGKVASSVYAKEYGDSIFNMISWANLYRVGMCQPGGRINDKTKIAQRKLCADLLIEEIRDLKPSAIVFLTGEWLDPFYDGDKEWTKLGYIQNFTDEKKPLYIGKFNFNLDDGLVIPTIVVPHPQGKKESDILPHIIEYVKPKILN